MPRKPTLPEEVKRYIVQAVACFDPPSKVAAAVKEQFGCTVTRQAVEYYNPMTAAGRDLPEKYRVIFAESRKKFCEVIEEIPITHRAIRLRALDRFAAKAEEDGNIVQAAN